MLPAVAAVVQKRVPVLIDGGVRRGTDIVKVRRVFVCGVCACRRAGVRAYKRACVRACVLRACECVLQSCS
jgi:hypothetical protein